MKNKICIAAASAVTLTGCGTTGQHPHLSRLEPCLSVINLDYFGLNKITVTPEYRVATHMRCLEGELTPEEANAHLFEVSKSILVEGIKNAEIEHKRLAKARVKKVRPKVAKVRPVDKGRVEALLRQELELADKEVIVTPAW